MVGRGNLLHIVHPAERIIAIPRKNYNSLLTVVNPLNNIIIM